MCVWCEQGRILRVCKFSSECVLDLFGRDGLEKKGAYLHIYCDGKERKGKGFNIIVGRDYGM